MKIIITENQFKKLINNLDEKDIINEFQKLRKLKIKKVI